MPGVHVGYDAGGLSAMARAGTAVCRATGGRGLALVEERVTWTRIVEDNIDVLWWSLVCESPPPCVEVLPRGGCV